ncbi:hypothetical protein [Burkholderia diffusa]|uniref:hypothetical protein n=1 Tax=Burkholderia diffusa TaxID=488732 RepID=UPI002ABE08F9|nr:hypothetical protein [Burkholderia diffusa]
MADATAPAVLAINGMEMSVDGEFLLIHGTQPTVALHRSTLHELLVTLPHAIEHAERMASNNDGVRFAVHSVGWEIGRIDDSRNLVIRFYVQGGAGFGFSVPDEQVPLIREALGMAADLSSSAAPAGMPLQ